MYKVMIAEDSKPILRNIKQLIERSGLPLEVVHTAFNGEDALEYIKAHPLDILLTDIRMPKLDGLALIEQAKPYYPDLKIVLISSYSDFEYTRKAITLQVFDYLLKPVEQQQLNDVISRVIRKLEEIHEMRQAMLGDIVDEERMLQPHNQKELFDQPKLMMLLGNQPFTSDIKWKHELIQPLISDLYNPHPSWLLPLKHTDRFLLLCSVSLRDKVPTGAAWMKELHDRLHQLDIKLSAVCHFEPIEPDRIYAAYLALETSMNQQLTLFRPILIEQEHNYNHPQHQRTADESIRILPEFIRHRQKEQYLLKLSERLKHIKLNNALWSELEQLISVIEGAFYEAWHEVAPEELTAEPIALIKRFDLQNYDAFCSQFLAWSEEQFQRLQSYNRKSGEELFAQMDHYIRQQIYTQLSINDLALKFHVSPSYVSRIMKRYTSQTFVQYFMNLKIEESCRLMQTKPNLKIRELSDALAFSDQHYFSRVFKDYTGFTPTEYKNQLQTEGV